MSIPTEDRPPIGHDVHTDELPPLPQRDSMIPAERWIEAPDAVRRLGVEIGVEQVTYIRRIHDWLLWRAGRAAGEPARYCAVRADDLADCCFFALDADGNGRGLGPDGSEHTRFRTWKVSLRDASVEDAGASDDTD
jgi:hypothetical protein